MKKFFAKVKTMFAKIIAYIKRPAFFIPFLIVWLIFQTPIIYGLIMGTITKDNKYYIIAGSWYALTAPPLPIPVVPICISFGLFIERLVHKK